MMASRDRLVPLVSACCRIRYAASLPILRIARTASRCTCGSLSSSSSVKSGSASLPPNCRIKLIAVRRTAAFGELFSRSTVRRATAPKASRIDVSRSRVRGRSSTASVSASGFTSTSPSDTHIVFTRSN